MQLSWNLAPLLPRAMQVRSSVPQVTYVDISGLVSPDGKWVLPATPFRCFESASGEEAWSFPRPGQIMGMAFHGNKLFIVCTASMCVCAPVSASLYFRLVLVA